MEKDEENKDSIKGLLIVIIILLLVIIGFLVYKCYFQEKDNENGSNDKTIETEKNSHNISDINLPEELNKVLGNFKAIEFKNTIKYSADIYIKINESPQNIDSFYSEYDYSYKQEIIDSDTFDDRYIISIENNSVSIMINSKVSTIIDNIGKPISLRFVAGTYIEGGIKPELYILNSNNELYIAYNISDESNWLTKKICDNVKNFDVGTYGSPIIGSSLKYTHIVANTIDGKFTIDGEDINNYKKYFVGYNESFSFYASIDNDINFEFDGNEIIASSIFNYKKQYISDNVEDYVFVIDSNNNFYVCTAHNNEDVDFQSLIIKGESKVKSVDLSENIAIIKFENDSNYSFKYDIALYNDNFYSSYDF